MGVNIWVNKGRIYLDCYVRGKRWRESTGLTITKDKAQLKEVMSLAEKLRSQKELQIVARNNGMHDPTAGRVLLADYLTEAAKGKSTQYAIHKLLHWIKKLRPNTRFDDLSYGWLENFQKELLEKAGVSPQTCELYCCALRTQFKQALRERLLTEDPGAGVPHIKTKKKMKPHLEEWEIQKLIETPITGQKTGIGPAIRQCWFFGVYTGLRISDLRTLRWGNIDVIEHRILKDQIKTDEAVSIPIKNEAWALINDDAEHTPDEFVFPRIARIPNIENTNPYLKKWGEDAKLTKAIGWHIARHTNATELLESGADIFTVMKLLGHSKIETTMGYAAVTHKKRKEAVDRLPDHGFGKKEDK